LTPLGYHARQRGLGLIGYLGVLALVMVAATLLVKIVRGDEAGGWRVRIHYQAEPPLSGNLSLVARFDDRVRLPATSTP